MAGPPGATSTHHRRRCGDRDPERTAQWWRSNGVGGAEAVEDDASDDSGGAGVEGGTRCQGHRLPCRACRRGHCGNDDGRGRVVSTDVDPWLSRPSLAAPFPLRRRSPR